MHRWLQGRRGRARAAERLRFGVVHNAAGILFEPSNANVVGVYNTETQSFNGPRQTRASRNKAPKGEERFQNGDGCLFHLKFPISFAKKNYFLLAIL